MKDTDLVLLDRIAPSILIEMRYATVYNFAKRALYPSLCCFLRKKVADKLFSVQAQLNKQGLGLKVYDGYRPHSVQKQLWEICPDPRFVADPKKGSKHSRGAAVDLTLVDRSGQELPIPTPFDTFTPQAHRHCQNLPADVLENRALLERAMEEQGFLPLPTEWWHFDDEEWESYPLVDLSFEALCALSCSS